MSIIFGSGYSLKSNNLGNGLRLIGISNKYVEINNDASLAHDKSSAFSVHITFYRLSLGSRDFLFDERVSGTGPGLLIFIETNNKLRLFLEGGAREVDITHNGTISANQIHTLTVTKDTGYSSINNWGFYLNNVKLSGFSFFNNLLAGDSTVSTDTRYIGRNKGVVQGLNGYMFNQIHFNKQLSQDEITYLYRTQGAIPSSAASNIVLNLPFNEKKGIILKDYSGNNNNGTLKNYSASETDILSSTNRWINADTLQPITQ